MDLERDEDEVPRWFAGASIGRRSGRIKAALLECIGEGWDMRVVSSNGLTTASTADGDESHPGRIAASLTELVSRVGVDLMDVEALGLHDLQSDRGAPLAAAIAERTGLTCIGQFAVRDRACGGRGYPLSPIPDWFLFHSNKERRLLVHLGATLRALVLEPESAPNRLRCFDVVPCCSFLDALVRRLSHQRMPFDPNGQLAVQGRASAELVAHWAGHPFFLRPTPRTIEPDDFGEEFHERALSMARELRLSGPDLLCSASHFIVEQLRSALDRIGIHPGSIGRVVVSGGGANNGLLWKLLQEAFAPQILHRSDALKAPSEMLRPLHAALLAYCLSENLPGNLPVFTGATGARLLGNVAPGVDAHWQAWIGRIADRLDDLRSREEYYRRAA